MSTKWYPSLRHAPRALVDGFLADLPADLRSRFMDFEKDLREMWTAEELLAFINKLPPELSRDIKLRVRRVFSMAPIDLQLALRMEELEANPELTRSDNWKKLTEHDMRKVVS